MDMKKFEKFLVTPRDQIKANPAKAGQAAFDILSKEQPPMETQEVIDEYKDDYLKSMVETLETNVNRYEPPFYVVVLSKKEPWAVNVMRNWFVARQTRPTTTYLRHEYPNHMNTVYSYDKRSSELKILWSLPTWQDSLVVLANPHLYDPTLVQWIHDCNSGALDRPEGYVAI